MSLNHLFSLEVHAQHRMREEHEAARKRALLRSGPRGADAFMGGFRHAAGRLMIAAGEVLTGRPRTDWNAQPIPVQTETVAMHVERFDPAWGGRRADFATVNQAPTPR